MKQRMIDLLLVLSIGLSALFSSADSINCVFPTIACALAIENFRFSQSRYKNIYMLIAIVLGGWVVISVGVTLYTMS